jgi:CheY-like chemotaxis protein
MCRVLVVDDDPDFVEIARLVLATEGHEVFSAGDAQLAFAMALRERPQIVLLDIMMEGALDGLNLSHQIRSEPTLRHTRVLMVSSITDTPNAQLFPTDEYLPADAWLTKPVAPHVLLKAVREYCHPDTA